MLVTVAMTVFGSLFSPIKLITGLVTGKSEVVQGALKGIAILAALGLGIFVVWYGYSSFFGWIEAKDEKIIQLGKTVESQKTTIDSLNLAVKSRDELLAAERAQNDFVRSLEENLRRSDEDLSAKLNSQVDKELTRDLGILRDAPDRENALRDINRELGRLFRFEN